jgi:hypothetical protein
MPLSGVADLEPTAERNEPPGDERPEDAAC